MIRYIVDSETISKPHGNRFGMGASKRSILKKLIHFISTKRPGRGAGLDHPAALCKTMHFSNSFTRTSEGSEYVHNLCYIVYGIVHACAGARPYVDCVCFAHPAEALSILGPEDRHKRVTNSFRI